METNISNKSSNNNNNTTNKIKNKIFLKAQFQKNHNPTLKIKTLIIE